jgi:hypothetical protein
MRFSLLAFLLFCLSSLSTWAGDTIRIGVFADTNGSACQARYPTNSLTVFQSMLNQGPLNHIISTGDLVAGGCMSYSGTKPYREVVADMWEEYHKKFSLEAQLKTGLLPVPAPGNHDAPFLFSNPRETFRIENQGFIDYWKAERLDERFSSIETPFAPANYPYYWAYTHKNILFIVLQSTRTHSLSNSVAQKAWLKAVLESPEAKSARVRIAYGHVPPYAVLDPAVGGKFREILGNEQVGKRDSLMDLLLDSGVELLVVGHSHAPYPGRLERKSDRKSIRILSMPCGHGPRRLRGKTALAPRGFSTIEISPSNTISIGIFNGLNGERIPAQYFPSSIPIEGAKAVYSMQYP